ncbi:flagellar export protein FliJ [Melioribacteraceae bacterium 4301-Me]|uniref:flagellar export protein FliJ n=1 Tax=Pyranulibacter aquaticus TaxID=3163344 RepID=UPI00359BD57D
MTAFVYKYETVKKVKEQKKNLAQSALSDVEKEILQLMDEVKKLNKNLTDAVFESAKAKTIGEILFKKNHELLILKKIDSLNKKIEQLKNKREILRQDLIQKTKEHKIFDTLENNFKEQFKYEQNKKENKQLDEISVQKFTRG